MRRLARWAAGLRLEQVPERVRAQAVHQVLSTLAAVYSGWESDLGEPLERAFPPPAPGPAKVVPTGAAASPAHAALLMASWSMVLDFDDVMLGGHTGHSSVLVPLAMAGGGGHSGAELLLAQITANEVAARINMVCAVGSTRGQMAAHLHLLAAAAARAKLEALDEETFAAALGFALSYPAQALVPAFLGSDAKALCAAWPIRVGLEAVDAVRAGLAAPADVLDDPRGFFATACRFPVREFLGGLGERWHTETNSFKIYPVCGYLCAAIDATLDLVRRHSVQPAEVAAVDVWASLFTVGMDAHSAPYLDGPRSRIATLTFSTPFTVASAILAGELGPAQLKRAWIEDPRVWRLAARVRSRHDAGLTLAALTADIPLGAALKRTRRRQAAAFGWGLAGKAFGPRGRWRRPWQTLRLVAGLAAAAGERRPLDLPHSTKPLGARVAIRLVDGRVLRSSVAIARGFAGAEGGGADGAGAAGADRRGVRRLMREKLTAAAGAVIGPARADEVAGLIEGLERLPAAGVERLLELACSARPARSVAGPAVDNR
ncbi:MAG TPA: MmgE/PrpD family protein [Thermoanaerobaculia bacterium]|nr:MmgE/PrpD family protein [Thermoanaerobaculia bacterium]